MRTPASSLTREEAVTRRETSRLRAQAEKKLITSTLVAPIIDTPRTPVALRGCDNKDITKRNSSRRTQNYLLVFPGSLHIPPGATIGTLSDLHTRTPSLHVTFDGAVIRLRGVLVFVKNSLLAVRQRKRDVQVVDGFDTLVVFSEWMCVGDLRSNPGQVPEPVPAALLTTPPAGRDNGVRDHVLSRYDSHDGDGDSDSDGYDEMRDDDDEVLKVRVNPKRQARVRSYVTDSARISGSESECDDDDVPLSERASRGVEGRGRGRGRGRGGGRGGRGGRGRGRKRDATDVKKEDDDDDDDDEVVEVVSQFETEKGGDKGRKRRKRGKIVRYSISDDEYGDDGNKSDENDTEFRPI